MNLGSVEARLHFCLGAICRMQQTWQGAQIVSDNRARRQHGPAQGGATLRWRAGLKMHALPQRPPQGLGSLLAGRGGW